MKKLVVTILSVTVLGIGGSAMASGAPTETPPIAPPHTTLDAEVVNDIAVPLDVLLYVQTQYQGYAVTHADKVTRDGKQAYRLRVDRSDSAYGSDSFYVLYDMNWKLIGEEKIAQPTQKTENSKPEQKQQASDKPKDEQPLRAETNTTTPTQPSQAPQDSTQSTTTTGNTGTTETTQPTTDSNGSTGTTQDGQTTPPTDGGSPNN